MEILYRLRERLKEKDFDGIRELVSSPGYRDYKESLLQELVQTEDGNNGLARSFNVLEKVPCDPIILRGCLTQIECYADRIQLA